MSHNLFKRRQQYPRPTMDVPRVIEGHWQIRLWYNTRPHGVSLGWQLCRKGARWPAHALATIMLAPSGQAYIVSSTRWPDDAFISWDEAVRNAIQRANSAAHCNG